MQQTILDRFAAAYDHPDREADRLRAQGARIARTIGSDIPRELLIAGGFAPVRMVATTDVAASPADAIVGSIELSARSRSLLQLLLTVPATDLVLISHSESGLPQLFSILREVAREGAARLPPVRFIDLKHLRRESTARYNLGRLQQLRAELEHFSGRTIEDDSLRQAIASTQEQREWLTRLRALRAENAVHLSGVQALKIIGSATILPVTEHVPLLRELIRDASRWPARPGRRVFITGSNHETAALYAAVESAGATVVGEDHDCGDALVPVIDARHADPLQSLASPALREPLVARSDEARRQNLRAGLVASRAAAVISFSLAGDEAAAWDVRSARHVCEESGLPLLVLDPQTLSDSGRLPDLVAAFLRAPTTTASVTDEIPDARAARKAPAPSGGRSRKSLRSLAALGEYQRAWFSELRQRALSGEAIAVVNANAPQEILRALDVPFVVNQWWASIVAAKQQSPRYLSLLRERGYPTDFDSYSAQGLAAAFDTDAANAPWGGLPKPAFLQALNSTDGTARLFEAWARETGADLFLFERTIDSRWDLFDAWWELLPDRWDESLEADRIDLLTEELREVIGRLERRLGRTFSMQRFTDVMNLVNEQEGYYRRTRDLIAGSSPAPVSIADTMPATMTPQWHRGTVWARDAARAFYEEVAERVSLGEAACANERIRLMWVGRGMWSEMGFYQRWEESHGAVFVWSMYLALAADGYIRTFDRGRDPLRALAARVITMGDELRMPTWAASWHVHEARTHQVDGAVALSDADPFVLRALTRAGIPVLALPLDNFNQEGVDRAAIESAVTEFIEGPAAAHATRRRA